MRTVYVYTPDTLADWELGYVTAELRSRRFFREDAPAVTVQTAGPTRAPVRTMGGLAVLPDCGVGEIEADRSSVLLLPGASAWDDPVHGAVLEKAEALLAAGGTVCAICGATAALANAGLLDQRRHTSNGRGYLALYAPRYRGQRLYVDRPSVADRGLITAGSAGALLWTRQILAHLAVFRPDTLEAWYLYFRTGRARHFFALLETLPGQAGRRT